MEEIAAAVNRIFLDSLYKPSEINDNQPPSDCVIVEGVIGKFGFHPGRLESHREEVISILREMDSNFFASSGGGYTFLNLCQDKNGNQWGEHQNCNELVGLVIGLKLGKYCLPREMWSALPGGVPYIVFNIPESVHT